MLTGENGILTQANNAKKDIERAEAKERIQLEVLGSYGTDGKIDIATLKANIAKNIPEAIIGEETDFPLTVTLNGYTFTINANGKVEEVESGEITPPETPIDPSGVATGGSKFTRASGTIDIQFLTGTTYTVGEANAPSIDEQNMVPVNWNGTNWVVTDEENWDYSYDETNKKWANVMLKDTLVLEGMTNEQVQTATIAQMKDKKVTTEGSMLVWIPRYAYKITYYETIFEYTVVQEMQLGKAEFEAMADFEKGEITNEIIGGTMPLYREEDIANADEGAIITYTYNEAEEIYTGKYQTRGAGTVNKQDIVGYSDARGIVDSEGKTPEGMAKPVTSISVGDYFRPHPAFETDLDQGGWNIKLTGFWMGKFETTTKQNNKITILPNTASYQSQTIGTSYTDAQNLGIANSHMAKNSEWGAMAYLTESKYGRAGIAVTRNNATVDGKITTGEGAYITNVDQSTTGNVYGIYDTVGGIWEDTAGYIADSSTNYGNSFASTDPEAENAKNDKDESTQYATVYEMAESNSTEENYTANINKKFGDGIIETSIQGDGYASAWHSASSLFVGITSSIGNRPFFSRSGGYGNPDAGSFSFYGFKGDNHGFRVCASVK